MRWLLAALLLTSSSAHGLWHVGAATGYSFSRLRAPESHYRVVPFYIHTGLSLKDACHWESMPGDLEIGIDWTANAIIDPKGGVETGAILMLLYRIEVAGNWQWYLEAGSGPSYLSIHTINLGGDGFNFTSQAGTGVYWMFEEGRALQLGYRYRHMSHAKLRHCANSGIDAHAFYVGLSRFF